MPTSITLRSTKGSALTYTEVDNNFSNLKTTADAAAVAGAATSSGLTMATNKLLGRTTASTGAIEEISIGSGLTFASGTLSASSSATLTIDNKTNAYTVVAGDLGKIINCTSGTFTVFLTAAATLGAGFNCWIWNTSSTDTDAITIDPNGSETIDGRSTLILRRGEGMQIVCDGTNWQTGEKKVMRGYAENIGTVGITRPIASASLATAIGAATVASSNYAFAAGLNSSGQGSQAVTGSGAMALNGSYASGTDSFAAAIGNNTSTYGAQGANSVAIGDLAKASSINALAIGDNAFSSALSTVAIGTRVTASQNYAVALGYGAISARIGKYAYSSGYFVVFGDAQTGKMVLRRQTTDATATVLTSDANAAGTTNQVTLPNDSTFAFRILVVARRTDADGESAGYEFTGVVDRNANAASTAIVGTVAKTVLAEDTSAWDVNVTADTTNGGLKVEVTGEAAKTINWVATVWTSEVTG